LAAALEFVNIGDLSAAERACTNLLQAAADDPAVLQLQATIALRRHAPQAALGAIERSLAARPQHIPSLLVAAQAARQMGAFAQAEVFLAATMPAEVDPKAIHARFPGVAVEWQALGMALRTAGSMAPAKAALRHAVDLAPGLAGAWFALGLTCQDLADEPGAAAAYAAALAARPDFAEAAVNLGIAQQRLGDMAAAVAAYRHAIRVRPDSFARIAQAVTAASTGMLWLDLAAFRRWLAAG
jgi:tetratricopeptide (TPR) repeat protein